MGKGTREASNMSTGDIDCVGSGDKAPQPECDDPEPRAKSRTCEHGRLHGELQIRPRAFS